MPEPLEVPLYWVNTPISMTPEEQDQGKRRWKRDCMKARARTWLWTSLTGFGTTLTRHGMGNKRMTANLSRCVQQILSEEFMCHAQGVAVAAVRGLPEVRALRSHAF